MIPLLSMAQSAFIDVQLKSLHKVIDRNWNFSKSKFFDIVVVTDFVHHFQARKMLDPAARDGIDLKSCRICLTTKKPLCPLFKYKLSGNYAEMLTAIADVKVRTSIY